MKPIHPLLIILIVLTAACTRVETSYYGNGQVKSEITMKGKVYHGAASYWYEDGIMQTQCHYENNELEGRLVSWHRNGARHTEQQFSRGKLHGLMKVFDTDGKLVSEGHYSHGILHGRYVEYYPDRGVKLEGTYENGKHEGTWLYFDIGGLIIGEGAFSKGTGRQRAFWENGKIKQLTHYVDDRKHGDEIHYRQDGSVEMINRFDSGKLVEKIMGNALKK